MGLFSVNMASLDGPEDLKVKNEGRGLLINPITEHVTCLLYDSGRLSHLLRGDSPSEGIESHLRQ
jgi:hypothetical protein